MVVVTRPDPAVRNNDIDQTWHPTSALPFAGREEDGRGFEKRERQTEGQDRGTDKAK